MSEKQVSIKMVFMQTHVKGLETKQRKRIAGMVVDFEGVAGPVSGSLKVGGAIRANRIEFMSRKLGIQKTVAQEFGREMLLRHGTDSYEFALYIEYGIPIAEYSDAVYKPIIEELRSEVAPREGLAQLLKKNRGAKGYSVKHRKCLCRRRASGAGHGPLF